VINERIDFIGHEFPGEANETAPQTLLGQQGSIRRAAGLGGGPATQSDRPPVRDAASGKGGDREEPERRGEREVLHSLRCPAYR
jgi:hypothetical protein